jgi:5-methylcytosine-specific restriction endonuclease McrA
VSPYAPARPCAVPTCPQLAVSRGRCRTHAAAQEFQRPNHEVRKWYYQAKWKRLRDSVLRENPLCVECKYTGRVTLATDVHHREKHEGVAEKFFDRTNLEGLCASHHAVHTRRGE